ncbi:hypothetical protein IT570_07405 [Candidatus Sumerlaeota bacterium]|nr:hypothetical protein [Candidatus Sumerlaeota bacterium]
MNESELKAIVEQVVRQLLAHDGAAVPGASQPESKAAAHGRRILVIINGSIHGHDAALQFIRALGGRGVTVVASPCYAGRYGQDALVAAAGCPKRVHTLPDSGQQEQFVDQAESVVYLMPVRTAIAKLANAMADDPTTSMITRALLRGLPVLAAGGDCDPTTWPKTIPAPMRQGRGSYTELLNESLDRLAGWGMAYRTDPFQLLPLLPWSTNLQVNPTPDPAEAPKAYPRSFMTAEDIRKKHADGAHELKLPPNCTITDEARELAASLSMKLIGPS